MPQKISKNVEGKTGIQSGSFNPTSKQDSKGKEASAPNPILSNNHGNSGLNLSTQNYEEDAPSKHSSLNHPKLSESNKTVVR